MPTGAPTTAKPTRRRRRSGAATQTAINTAQAGSRPTQEPTFTWSPTITAMPSPAPTSNADTSDTLVVRNLVASAVDSLSKRNDIPATGGRGEAVNRRRVARTVSGNGIGGEAAQRRRKARAVEVEVDPTDGPNEDTSNVSVSSIRSIDLSSISGFVVGGEVSPDSGTPNSITNATDPSDSNHIPKEVAEEQDDANAQDRNGDTHDFDSESDGDPPPYWKFREEFRETIPFISKESFESMAVKAESSFDSGGDGDGGDGGENPRKEDDNPAPVVDNPKVPGKRALRRRARKNRT